MMPLNYILWKCTRGYKLHKTQENINHLIYMDDIKLLAKNEKELETLIQAVRKWRKESSSSSKLCRTASTDLPDSHSLPVSIVHRSREVFQATSCIETELLYVGSSWSSYLCLSMWRGPRTAKSRKNQNAQRKGNMGKSGHERKN